MYILRTKCNFHIFVYLIITIKLKEYLKYGKYVYVINPLIIQSLTSKEAKCRLSTPCLQRKKMYFMTIRKSCARAPKSKRRKSNEMKMS